MQALLYLYKKTFVNRLKKALKKPVTYIYLVFGMIYVFMVIFGFDEMIHGTGIDSDKGLVAVLTILVFFISPVNFISYAKRKGLVYLKSDVHFVFTAPISPKMNLMYAQVKQIMITFMLGIILSFGGIFWFGISPIKMVFYFIFSSVVENILEGSLVILLYGNERIPHKYMKIIPILVYICMAAFVVIGFTVLSRTGFTMDGVIEYLFTPALQLVPIIGWNIAVLHLLFIGPSTITVIGTSLYVISVIVLFIMAGRMRCTGEYYEEAIKFADDYAIAREKGKKGEVSFIGKDKKFVKATINYKGTNAKAIFYRQLLEYKKNRFFIFDMNSLLMLLFGIGIAVLQYMTGSFDEHVEYIIPGVMAYIAFIFTGMASKWQKELANPYTFLIPDTSFRKLWYATLIEHIRAIVDACLLTIPAAIALKLTPLQALLTIGIYVCLQANKLYITVFAEGLLGNLLGTFGKQILRMLLFGTIVAIGVAAAVVGTIVISIEAGFFLLILTLLAITFICMLAASGIFDRMEAPQ